MLELLPGAYRLVVSIEQKSLFTSVSTTERSFYLRDTSFLFWKPRFWE